jgi:hypothetical protein
MKLEASVYNFILIGWKVLVGKRMWEIGGRSLGLNGSERKTKQNKTKQKHLARY